MKKNIYVKDSKYHYTSCDDCKFADDSATECKERLCVHAISSLVDCFVPKTHTPDIEILKNIFDKFLIEIIPSNYIDKVIQNVIAKVNNKTLIWANTTYIITVTDILYNILFLKYGSAFTNRIDDVYREDIINFLKDYFID